MVEEHGLTFRGQRIRTGLNHVTVGDMASGIVPSLDTVEKFARGFGLDVNEWRALAGYERVEDDPSPEALLWDGVRAAAMDWAEAHPDAELNLQYHRLASKPPLTREEAEAAVAQFRETLESAPDSSRGSVQVGRRRDELVSLVCQEERTLAGYERVDDASPRTSPQDYWKLRWWAVAELCERLGIPEPAKNFGGGYDALTHEKVDEYVEQLLGALRADYPEHARELVL